MPLWIMDSSEHKIETQGVSFRHRTMHGPFENDTEAAIYWRKYAGAAPGEAMPPYYDEPVLIDMDLPESLV